MADEQQRRAQDGGSARDRHVPVMMERTLELLAPALSKGPAVVVDATLGMGGHSEALLAAHPELDRKSVV